MSYTKCGFPDVHRFASPAEPELLNRASASIACLYWQSIRVVASADRVVLGARWETVRVHSIASSRPVLSTVYRMRILYCSSDRNLMLIATNALIDFTYFPGFSDVSSQSDLSLR